MKKNGKNTVLFLTVVLILFSFISSCTFRNEEQLELNPCDTSNVTYASVQPIFENICVRCHNEQINNLGIILTTYENAKSAAQTGLLYKAVNHLPGVTPMPYQLPQLDDCDVRKITIWINKNAPH